MGMLAHFPCRLKAGKKMNLYSGFETVQLFKINQPVLLLQSIHSLQLGWKCILIAYEK